MVVCKVFLGGVLERTRRFWRQEEKLASELSCCCQAVFWLHTHTRQGAQGHRRLAAELLLAAVDSGLDSASREASRGDSGQLHVAVSYMGVFGLLAALRRDPGNGTGNRGGSLYIYQGLLPFQKVLLAQKKSHTGLVHSTIDNNNDSNNMGLYSKPAAVSAQTSQLAGLTSKSPRSIGDSLASRMSDTPVSVSDWVGSTCELTQATCHKVCI